MVHRRRRRRRGLDGGDRPQRQPVGLVGRPGRRRRGGDRQPPGLGAARRRVRRAARHRLARSLAVDQLRERGRHRRPGRSRWSAFAEEEGARFGVACLGSRLLTGALDAGRGRRRCTDRDGVTPGRGDAGGRADPDASARTRAGSAGSAPSWSCTSSRAGRWPTWTRRSGSATAIWPHGRWRIDFTGEGNHAGTTAHGRPARPDAARRRTPCWPPTRRPGCAGAHATVGRVTVAPNATNAIAVAGVGWLDARARRRRRP